ncbi:MAG: iron ABC transporter permease [Tissierellales bacterium]|nr:iron ABC transporter permease [Tissierellales bacterium]MBN2827383.1 iron ABC transporter permease [Tissierellales bacterium]
MKQKNSKLIKILYGLIIGFLVYFILLPVMSVIVYGIKSENSLFFSMKGLERSLGYLKNSLIVSFSVTAIATCTGVMLAFTLNRIKFVGRGLLKLLVLLPFVNPPFVGSISYIMLFGRRGLISNKLLGLSISPYGPWGIVVIQVLGLSSLAYILIASSIKKTDTTLEAAARNLGANENDILRSITIPMMLPEISSTALLVFLASMADFSTPLIIGGNFQTLASDLYIQITGLFDMKSAAVSGLILLIPCIAAFVIQKYHLQKKSYFTEETLSSSIEYEEINAYTKFFLISFTAIFISFIFIKYFFIIVGAFTKQWGYNYTLTFSHVNELIGKQYKPFINSIKLAFITASLGSFLGMLIAYLIRFKKLFLSNFVDFAATLPAAVPGILFGIGYLVAFKYPILGIGKWIFTDIKPWILLGTGSIIYLIMIARFINTGLRSGYALLEHINPDMEKASYNLGAGEIETFFRIMAPLMKDAFFASFIRAFTSGMITLGAIIFLLMPSNKVAVQQIFQVVNGGNIGAGAAISLTLSLLTLFLLGVFYTLFNIVEYMKVIKRNKDRLNIWK